VNSKPVANTAPAANARTAKFVPDTEIASDVESATPSRDTEIPQEINADTETIPTRLIAKSSSPLKFETSEDIEPIEVPVLASPNASSLASDEVDASEETNVSDKSNSFQAEPAVATADVATQLQQSQMLNNAARASTAPARSQSTPSIDATKNPARTPRVSDHDENDLELVKSEIEPSVASAIPIELFLGAVGIQTAPAPREISSASVDAEASDETRFVAEDADFSFDSDVGAHFKRAVAASKDDAASQTDFAADVEDVTVHVPAANQQAASDAEVEQEPAFVADLGEVRVIASQSTSRKNVQAVAADDTKQKEIEIQPLRTELRAAASDNKSVAQVPANDRNAAFSSPFASGEKIARQSSPEGISFEAGQREISASTVTAPFVDGGRPETIASRNSTAPAAPPTASRAEQLLDHTLDAIPNPLRVTTFEIKPEGHGVIRVRISARGEGEKAVWRVQIQTNDPAARSLLSEHLNELRERLPAENVQVELRGANDVRTEVSQRENGGSRERNGEQRQSRGEEQRQPKQQKSGTFLEWLAAQE